jgi:hypothetical protein
MPDRVASAGRVGEARVDRRPGWTGGIPEAVCLGESAGCGAWAAAAGLQAADSAGRRLPTASYLGGGAGRRLPAASYLGG